MDFVRPFDSAVRLLWLTVVARDDSGRFENVARKMAYRNLPVDYGRHLFSGLYQAFPRLFGRISVFGTVGQRLSEWSTPKSKVYRVPYHTLLLTIYAQG